ncbi:MAG: arginine--tRNA ligase [Bryobacterales bacterium]|nr:arginine--tRNA ligase [Bryobacterales bacterium]
MFHKIQQQLQQLVSEHLQVRYGVDMAVTLDEPADAKFGELACTAAFPLAKQLRRAPRAIAQELVADLGDLPGVAALEIAGAGYINIRLNRSAYGTSLLQPSADEPATGTPSKIIVEHTNINPNKAAHIGHLRNSVLGDTFCRMLRAAGNTVEVQNYIDNTGVQVADVVAGFHFLEKKTPAEVAELATEPRFDYLCWDLYARTSQHFKDNPEDERAWRHASLHAIEAGEGELAEMAHTVADAIVLCHLETMRRLGIHYDVLPRESEILHLKFWATAFELLKARKAIYLEEEGPKKGCWVMAGAHYSDNAAEDDSKVIVRSNGIVTYVGKDMAYQLWKFGLLGKDFYYRKLLTEANGHVVWVTTDEPQQGDTPKFGGGSTVYNVIDSRQSYLQDVVAAGLRALNYEAQAERSIHFSYEMVALSPRACAELGIELSEEDKQRAHVQVSGRKGLGVKADDLIDKLIENALKEVNDRHPEAAEDERKLVATQIATGALRYFMLKYTRNTVIAFDMQEALSFEGDTGPYVQYAAVRSRNIIRKLEDRGETLPNFNQALTPEAFTRQLGSDDLWQLILAVSKVDSAIAKAIASGEPAHVAKYAFQLAQTFNTFYHDFPVLSEADAEKRTFLLWLTDYFRRQLERTLGILGIPAPQYM